MSASLVEDLIPPTKSLHSLLHDFLTWKLQNCGEEKLSTWSPFCKLQNYKNFHDHDFELSTRSPFCLSTILLPCSTLFTMSFFVFMRIFSEAETLVCEINLNDNCIVWFEMGNTMTHYYLWWHLTLMKISRINWLFLKKSEFDILAKSLIFLVVSKLNLLSGSLFLSFCDGALFWTLLASCKARTESFGEQ